MRADTAERRVRILLHSHHPYTRPHDLNTGNFLPWRNGQVYDRQCYPTDAIYEAVVRGHLDWNKQGKLMLGGKHYSRGKVPAKDLRRR